MEQRGWQDHQSPVCAEVDGREAQSLPCAGRLAGARGRGGHCQNHSGLLRDPYPWQMAEAVQKKRAGALELPCLSLISRPQMCLLTTEEIVTSWDQASSRLRSHPLLSPRP